MRYRIIAKSGGVTVTDEKTDSLKVMNDVVRALLAEGGNEVIVYDDGRPYHIGPGAPSGLGAEVDEIIADFFAFEAI